MKLKTRYAIGICTGCVVALLTTSPVLAQEEAVPEETKPWQNEAQIALVDTAGNASSRTFAVSNRFSYNWTYSELILTLELFRATSGTRVLENTADGVTATFVDKTDSERYEAAGKYRMNIVDELFWYAGAGWFRNRPAGIDTRTSLGAGAGYRFVENDTTLVAGEAGLGLDRETPVGGDADTFVSARAFLEARHALSENARFKVGLEAIENLQNTSDLRINATASVTSQLTDAFALRVAWDLKYDNDPATRIVTGNGLPPGLFVFDKTDRTLSASLVVNL